MNEIIVIILFVLWYVGALLVSENAKKKNKKGTEWLFFISIIFSPLVGSLVLLFAKKS